MAAEYAGGGAWRIQQHRVQRLWRLPCAGIGADQLRRKAQPAHIVLQPAQARSRAFNAGDRGARSQHLRALASRRGAQVGNGFARPGRQDHGGQRRSGILHLPGALGKTRPFGNRAPGARRSRNAQGLRPQQRPAQAFPDPRRIIKQGQVNGRRLRQKFCRILNRRAAPVLRPAFTQPGGDVGG